MAISNGSGSFNTGRDATVVLIGPTGRVQIPNVTSFDSKQEVASIRVDRLDGVQLGADVAKGWSGSLECERGSAAIDTLFAAMEAAWLTSGSYTVSALYLYINETNGSTSTWQYNSVALKLDDAGSWKSDAAVKQKISFWASSRTRV